MKKKKKEETEDLPSFFKGSGYCRKHAILPATFFFIKVWLSHLFLQIRLRKKSKAIPMKKNMYPIYAALRRRRKSQSARMR